MKIKGKNRPLKRCLFPLPLPIYLSYLVVCTLLLTGVSFSSYLSTTNATDSARVAAGIVSVTYDSATVIEMERPTMGDMVTKQFHFSVSNQVSEVAIRYDVVVTLGEALPKGITMELDGKPCSGNTDNTYTFSNMGTFEAGTSTSFSHKLTFTGDFAVYQPLEEEAEFPINISVYAEQID